MSTIVLTGGAGALGSHLCRELAKYHSVRILDNRALPGEPPEGVAYFSVDATDFDSILPAFAGADTVIHAAGLHPYHLPNYSADAFFTNNVLSTFHIICAAEREGVKRLIFTSSTSIYGASADPVDGAARWIDESTPLRWRDLYDTTKVAGERLCAEFARSTGATVVCLRPTRFFFDDYLQYNIRKLWRGVDVRDVVQAHALAATVALPSGVHTYNVAAKTSFRPEDIRDLWSNAPGVVEREYPGSRALLAARHATLPTAIGRVYDITKIERDLGFRPRHNFPEFLDELRAETAGDVAPSDDFPGHWLGPASREEVSR